MLSGCIKQACVLGDDGYFHLQQDNIAAVLTQSNDRQQTWWTSQSAELSTCQPHTGTSLLSLL